MAKTTKAKTKAKTKVTAFSPVSNDGEAVIKLSEPYSVQVGITGTAPLLFHRWSVEAVAEKGRAAKGSKAKREDDLESYVYRNEKGYLCVPGEYLRQSIINAAKFRQDPRSPRKSAVDIFKAGIIAVDPLCSLGLKEWSYVDQRRVMVQRNGITRSRPAINTGWKIACQIQVLLPEYIPSAVLNEVIQNAGRLIGIGDFRPSYGRFQVTGFRIS